MTVYDKRGNPLVIKESLKDCFIGKGYTQNPPKTDKPKKEIEDGQ